MKIFAETLNGKSITLDNVQPCNTIADIKIEINAKTSIPSDQLQLFFKDRQLDDSNLLSCYGITNHSIIGLSFGKTFLFQKFNNFIAVDLIPTETFDEVAGKIRNGKPIKLTVVPLGASISVHPGSSLMGNELIQGDTMVINYEFGSWVEFLVNESKDTYDTIAAKIRENQAIQLIEPISRKTIVLNHGEVLSDAIDHSNSNVDYFGEPRQTSSPVDGMSCKSESLNSSMVSADRIPLHQININNNNNNNNNEKIKTKPTNKNKKKSSPNLYKFVLQKNFK